MYFKRLEVQGFKTFANRTEFEFNSDITAIVGPNGSGKSNIADAVRWVLGEQTIRLLRAKRAEDLIFAGSSARAPLGMAEVTITLDNTEGWFPLPYSEVTIARRAYRSGDNEYLINKQRVRLRDVGDLLAKANLGQNTYTVIGQGLVDAVLNLRPEERRELFEEAADIKRYYTKLNETQTKLATTEQNIVRAEDVAAEIAPKLASLEKQARLAEQRQGMAQELTALQHIWYAKLQSKALARVAETGAREGELRSGLATLEAQQESLSRRLSELRELEEQAQASLARLRGESEPLKAERASLAKETAIDSERWQTYAQQLEELSQETASLKADEAAQTDRLATAREQMAAIEVERQNATAAVRRAEREIEEIRRRTAEGLANLSLLRSNAFEVLTSAADVQRKSAQAGDRRQAAQRDVRECEAAIEHRATQASTLQARIEAVEATISQTTALLESLGHKGQEIQRLVRTCAENQEQLATLLEGQQRKRHELHTRFELISRWEDSQNGYFPGVRAVLQAGQSRRGVPPTLNGIVSIVGKAMRPESQAETALEVALGSRVQDIIVERWQDAEKAIAFLKHSRAGRATFLPLDTIGSTLVKLPPLNVPGILGLAAELVHFEPRFQSIVNLLLGKTIVVEDLKVARRVLRDCPSGWQIVTLSGEMVRSSGAITGGSPSNQSGVLSRMRELRELPDQIGTLERRIEETHGLLKNERVEHRRLIAAQDLAEQEQREATSRLRTTREELASLRREKDRLRADQQRLESRQKQLAEELHQLSELDTTYGEQLRRVSSESAVASEVLQAAEAETLKLRQDEEKLSGALSDAKVSSALAEQKHVALTETIARAQSTNENVRRQIEARQDRAAQIEALRVSIGERMGAGQARLRTLGDELDALESLVKPAEQRIAQLRKEYNSGLTEEPRLRAAHNETLRLHHQAALDAQRSQDELATLNQRIREELGEEAVSQMEGQVADGGRDAMDGSPASSIAGLRPEELKRRIDRLKSELRSLASVSLRAVEEYQEALSRHNFLTEQAGDLRRGAEALRQVIAELHKTMKKRFEETFKAVASEFQVYFRALFGGGMAHLTLTEPGDFTQTGVDIVAQPPGKRLQNLALLSGGERALTGVALLFAILKINPSPVCVLDEVDAALDEANIGRFCAALQTLARNTQFIVITHNRKTMEIASNLYGVSMAESGISKVVSLRLPESGQSSTEPQPASTTALATAS